MQTPKARNGRQESPPKMCIRAMRHQKATPANSSDAASPSSSSCRTPKQRSPNSNLMVPERHRSPRSPPCNMQKKRPDRITELESQVLQLQEDLKKTKDELIISTSENNKKQTIWQQTSEVDGGGILQKQLSVESLSTLACAKEEIQRLKQELKMVADSEAAETKKAQFANLDLKDLNGTLLQTLSLVESMKNQLIDCKETEAQAHAIVTETLQQLGNAKATVEALRVEGMKTTAVYSSIVSELDQSRARVAVLEALVTELDDSNDVLGFSPLRDRRPQAVNYLGEVDSETLNSLIDEAESMRCAVQNAETKYHEEHKVLQQAKYREAELERELSKAMATIQDLKEYVIDKEMEIGGVLEENQGLKRMVEKLRDEGCDSRARLIDKDSAVEMLLEENAMLKEEVKKSRVIATTVSSKIGMELEAARLKEALVKVDVLQEEVEKSNRKAATVEEKLEAAQATETEMEAELRKLKVQTDQWRKAAEAAVAMLSVGHGGAGDKFLERSGSFDSSYNKNTPYAADYMDDDHDMMMLKKKNNNMLTKFGILRKKQHK